MPVCRSAASFAKRDGVYVCLPFVEQGWVDHGFSVRGAQLAHSPITLKQVHSADVLNAYGLEDRAASGDALITNRPGILVGVRTADCVPILLADSKSQSVAAIHAGWRGTVAGIARNAVARLAEEFGVDPGNLHAAIGPAIRACSYEVKEDVADQFRPIFPEWTPDHCRGGRCKLDLIEANKRVLVAAGIPAGQIYDSGMCTFCCAQEFHSYRRDPLDGGRMISFIGRRDGGRA